MCGYLHKREMREKQGKKCHFRTALPAPCWTCLPKEGHDLHASLGRAGHNLCVLHLSLQLACLTWWTRHKKSPDIDLRNYKSESAQMNSANGEGDLLESADLGNKEEEGRSLTVDKHIHVHVNS